MVVTEILCPGKPTLLTNWTFTENCLLTAALGSNNCHLNPAARRGKSVEKVQYLRPWPRIATQNFHSHSIFTWPCLDVGGVEKCSLWLGSHFATFQQLYIIQRRVRMLVDSWSIPP